MTELQKLESEDLKELYAALAKAQEEMASAKLDSQNPYFKSQYADLHSIIQASRPSLSKNGLAVIQRIMKTVNGNMYLATRLCHASGQWIESEMPIDPPKKTIQDIGSYITYVKRYAYAALVGVVASDDKDDDDGEAVMDHKLNQEQVGQIASLTQKLDDDQFQGFLKYYKIEKVSEIPFSKFDEAMKHLRNAITKNQRSS